MTSFSFFKYFAAFELDVNVVNFVYYGKTRIVSFLGFVQAIWSLLQPHACGAIYGGLKPVLPVVKHGEHGRAI